MRVAVTVEQSWHVVPGDRGSTVELLRALVDRGDVELVGVAAAHRNPPADAFIPPVSIRSLPLPRRALYESWQWLRRPRVERATGPWTSSTTPVTSSRRRRRRSWPRCTICCSSSTRSTTWHSRAVLRRGLTLARRDARVVICPSRATIDACRAAGFEDERLRLVPWGVRHRTVEEGAAERTRRRYGLAGPYVLFCGTVEPRKNLPRVLGRSGGSISPTWNSSPAHRAGGRTSRTGRRTSPDGCERSASCRPTISSHSTGAATLVYPSLAEDSGSPCWRRWHRACRS